MSAPSTPDNMQHPEPPLWSIGLAVMIILGAPVILYSLAPSGPLREGDTVFSDGQQRVRLTKPPAAQLRQSDDTCLLDPDNPLIVVRSPDDHPEGLIVAEVQGRAVSEWPFCPPHAEVLLTPNQTFQKPAVLTSVNSLLKSLSAR